jgi:drug/metabolite transporter (DMT)-like permease
MELSGILLGVTVALLWGSADSISAFAARSIGALRTTLFSQLAGLLTVAILSAFFPLVWQSFTPLMILLGACSGLLAAVGYYAFYRGLAAGPVTLVSTISSGSSIVTFLLAFLLLNESLSPGHLIALGIIFLGLIQASTDLREIRGQLSPKSRSPVRGSSGVKWALLTVVTFGAMDFSVGLSATISSWFLPVLFMRCFSLLFLSTIQLWTHYQIRVKQHSGTHFQEFQAKNAPVILSREKRTVLRAEDILGDAALILPSRKPRNTQKGILSGLPAMITSMEKLQNLRKAPLIDITNKLLPPVNLLPTRSVIGVLSRLTSTTPLQPATTLVLPSTTIIHSGMAGVRGILLAIVAGGLESVAVLLFSRATQLTSTGITSVLASDYAVVSLLVGLIVFRERLNLRQIVGMALILGGICLLALSPI